MNLNRYTRNSSRFTAKAYIMAFLLIMFFGNNARAIVSVTTSASGGTGLSADKASNATSPAWTTLGSIVITEGANGDFANNQTSLTFLINAPSGWSFNTAASLAVSFTASKDITSMSIVGTSSSVITVTFTTDVGNNGRNAIDVVTITGVQIRAIDGGNVPGTSNLAMAKGTGTVSNLDGLICGALSQVVGNMTNLVITLPGQTFSDAVTKAASGNSGTVTNQTVGTSFNISKITATDQFFNIVTSYAGSKTLAYSGPATTGTAGGTAPSYTTAVNFTSGQSTTTLTTTLYKAETSTITVTQGGLYGVASSNLIIGAKPITVTPSAGQTKVYGGADPTPFTYSSAGLLGSDAVTGLMSRTVGENVGAYTFTNGTLTAGANYTLSVAITPTFSITTKALTVTATGPLKTYGAALTSGPSAINFTAGATGVGAEAVTSVTLIPDAAGLSATTAAGSAYVVTPSLATGTGGFIASNYNITYNVYNGTVAQKALTVTATGPSKTYGTALTAGASSTNFTSDATGVGAEVVTSVTLTPDAAGLSATTAAGAAYVVTPSDATGTGGFLASNYNITFTTYNGTVAAKPLSITANNQSKCVGDAFTFDGSEYTSSGLVNGDNITGLTITSDGAPSGATANTYLITPSAAIGTGLTNYTISYVDGLFTVNALPQGSLTANGPFCETGAGQLTWTATVGTGPYTIIYNDGTSDRTATDVVSGIPFDVFTNPVTRNTTYTLVSVQDANCSRSFDFTESSATINVNPSPAIDLAVGSAGSVCLGAGTNITVAASVTGTSYQLRNGIANVGSPIAGNGNTINLPTGNLSSTTTFNVLATLGTCSAQLTQTAEVIVNAPTVSITGSTSICVEGRTYLSPTTGGTWESNSTSAQVDPLTGVVIGLTPGSATFTFTDGTTGCSSTTPAVTVVAKPTTATAGVDQSIAGALPLTSSSLGGNAPGTGETGEWSQVSGPTPDATFSNSGDRASTATVTKYGTYTFRWSISNGTCSTHEDVTVSYSMKVSIADGSWFTPGTWSPSGVPTSTDDVTVAHAVTIESGVTGVCSNLTVSSGKSLTVAAGGALTVSGNLTNNGTFTINSDASLSGSLIVNGSNTGYVTYNRYVESGRWYITASPVYAINFATGNATTGVSNFKIASNNTYDFATLRESTNEWIYPTSIGDPIRGTGYLVRLKDGYNNIQYKGALNGDFSVTIGFTITSSGWNAVGNPFTSSIGITTDAGSAQSFLDYNAAKLATDYAAIYVWNQTGSYNPETDDYYKVINNSGYIPNPENYPSLTAKVVQAGQGFLINVLNTPGTGNIAVTRGTTGMQLHNTTESLKSAQISWPGITLKAENGGNTRTTVVAFNSNMTEGIDKTYDAGLFSASDFNVYTRLANNLSQTDLAIQCLPEGDWDKLSVPIGLDLPEGGEITFKAAGVILPDGLFPVIEDRQLKRRISLKSETDSYKVILAGEVSGIGRFYLHIGGVIMPEDPKDIVETRYSARFDNDRITIFGNVAEPTKASLYDLMGRKLGEYPLLQDNYNDIPAVGLTQRVYVVKIEGKGYRQSIKVPVAK